jgi:hypothetical protein
VLGIRFSADQAAQMQDVDGASFERLSVVLQDRVEERLAGVFGAPKFEPVPSVDPDRVWLQTEQETLVEFLTPSFEESEGLKDLPALGTESAEHGARQVAVAVDAFFSRAMRDMSPTGSDLSPVSSNGQGFELSGP